MVSVASEARARSWIPKFTLSAALPEQFSQLHRTASLTAGRIYVRRKIPQRSPQWCGTF